MRQSQTAILIGLAFANLLVFVGLGFVVMNWNGVEASFQTLTATPNPAFAPTEPPSTSASSAAVPFAQLTTLQASTVVVVTPEPTLVPTATLPYVDVRFLVGESVEGRPIVGFAFPSQASDATALVLVSGIHGDEMNAWPVLESLVSSYYNHTRTLPPSLSLYIIESLNPDGTASNVRFNANGVDLNRNWGTTDWKTNVEVGSFEFLNGGGGPEPFSEPETRQMRDFLLNLQIEHPGGVTVIYMHAAFPPRGMVLPGVYHVNGQDIADSGSRELGLLLSEAADYNYSNVWNGNYTVTGDATTWAVDNDIKALTIELPVRTPLDLEAELNLRDALLVVINSLAGN
jgi:hypothetical protein